MPKTEQIRQLTNLDLNQINERFRITQRLIDGIFETFGEEYLSNYLNNARHDILDRHDLGTVVPHDSILELTDVDILNNTFRDNENKFLKISEDGTVVSAEGMDNVLLGTANQIIITDNGDGTYTISLADPLIFPGDTQWADAKYAQFGDSQDLTIGHNATNSVITNITGELIFDSPTTFTFGTGAAVNYTFKFPGSLNTGTFMWANAGDRFEFGDDVLLRHSEHLYFTDTDQAIYAPSANLLNFVAPTRLQFLMDGLTPHSNLIGNTEFLFAHQAASARATFACTSSNANHTPTFRGHRARGTLAAPSAVQSGDRLFSFSGAGFDGLSLQYSAAVLVHVDGAVAIGNVPARLDFQAGTSTGAGRPTRFTIKSDGEIRIPADNQKLVIGAGQDAELYWDTNDFIFDIVTSGDWVFKDDVRIDSTAKLYLNDLNSYIHDDGTDLELVTNGNIKFGTYAAITTETLQGFITIKDSAGNTRKIAVVA